MPWTLLYHTNENHSQGFRYLHGLCKSRGRYQGYSGSRHRQVINANGDWQSFSLFQDELTETQPSARNQVGVVFEGIHAPVELCLFEMLDREERVLERLAEVLRHQR